MQVTLKAYKLGMHSSIRVWYFTVLYVKYASVHFDNDACFTWRYVTYNRKTH